jgi:hypothetical protein
MLNKIDLLAATYAALAKIQRLLGTKCICCINDTQIKSFKDKLYITVPLQFISDNGKTMCGFFSVVFDIEKQEISLALTAGPNIITILNPQQVVNGIKKQLEL